MPRAAALAHGDALARWAGPVRGGGYGDTLPLDVAALYDPADGSWSAAAPLVEARTGWQGRAPAGWLVLVVGGVGAGGGPLASVERI